MAETSAISKMAAKLSSELFQAFLWSSTGPRDQNWLCLQPDQHKKKTHPTDVVFYYDEPYSQTRTYINCDLKSYAKDSISPGAIHSALKSLALAISCAEQSAEWRERYTHDGFSPAICGLLFLYNHDGQYDTNFKELFRTIKFDDIKVPSGSKLFVLGPLDIEWLDNVHYEINQMRGTGKLAPPENCRFYYPHLVLKKNVQMESARAATLEMLTSPWLTLLAEPAESSNKTAIVFYRDRGETTEEFLYLLDYLMHYQLITIGTTIHEYIENYQGGRETADRLRSIELSRINRIHTSFSEIEIGMESD
jgi:hypothetical protein